MDTLLSRCSLTRPLMPLQEVSRDKLHQTMISTRSPKMVRAGSLYKFTRTTPGLKRGSEHRKTKLDLEIRTFFCLAQVDVLFSFSNYLRCVSPALLPDIKKVPWGLSCVKLGCSKVHRASRLKAGEIGRRPSHLLRWKWLQKWWMVSFQLACLFSLALKCDSFFFMNIPWRWWEMPRFERKVNWLEFAFFLTFFGAFSAQFLPVFSQIYALQPLML